MLSPVESVLLLLAGLGAGTINTIVGSGTLITFPVLLALGYNPVAANVANTIGLVPGSVSGAIGYREELRGERGRLLRFGAASVLGGIAGAGLLLTLPDSAFDAIVPVLIALALVLVVLQPRLSGWLTARRGASRPLGGPALRAGIFGTGIYGGYFGAAQGIILLALMGVSLPDELQKLNAIKNVLAGLVNFVAALVFIVLAPEVAWLPALIIAAGSIAGGQLGATVGRRLPPAVLRGVILVVGTVAIVVLLV